MPRQLPAQKFNSTGTINHPNLATLIRAVLILRGFTIQEFTDKLGINYTAFTNNWFKNNVLPDKYHQKVAQILNISITILPDESYSVQIFPLDNNN